MYPYDLILLKSECSYPTYQTRVGPVAKLLGRALLKVRRKRHTMQVVAEVARWVPVQAAELEYMVNQSSAAVDQAALQLTARALAPGPCLQVRCQRSSLAGISWRVHRL